MTRGAYGREKPWVIGIAHARCALHTLSHRQTGLRVRPAYGLRHRGHDDALHNWSCKARALHIDLTCAGQQDPANYQRYMYKVDTDQAR